MLSEYDVAKLLFCSKLVEGWFLQVLNNKFIDKFLLEVFALKTLLEVRKKARVFVRRVLHGEINTGRLLVWELKNTHLSQLILWSWNKFKCIASTLYNFNCVLLAEISVHIPEHTAA